MINEFVEVGDFRFLYKLNLITGSKRSLLIFNTKNIFDGDGEYTVKKLVDGKTFIWILLPTIHTKDPHKLAASMFESGMSLTEIEEYFTL